MHNIIKDIANKENGTLWIEDSKEIYTNGSRSPSSTYTIKVEYKGQDIILFNTIGSVTSGKIICELNSNQQFPTFEILTKSHFESLFLGKNSRLKIKSNSKRLKIALKREFQKSTISHFFEHTRFEPYIFSEIKNNKYIITTTYNLEFEGWFNVISPLLEFYRTLIDLYNDDLHHQL